MDLLKLKVDGLADLERECVLSLDEMAITPSVELHMLTGKLYGNVTLPGHRGVATHACVFMLAGNTTRWKQVVAYHYSGNSTNGAEYRPIITEIIERAASIGLHVLDVTTDMGSPNQAMWKSFGVDHTKTSVPHPTTPDRHLYFMPDVPHLVKNLKSALVRGQVLTIPQNVVNKENLPSNKVSVVPIKDLLSFQEGMALKVAPHLSAAAIEPSHFEKMKVGPALNVFSKATSAGLKYMVQQENRPLSYLTTAWFLEQVDHWFDLMSSRHPITALSRVKMEEYEKAIIFLQDIIHLFHGMKIGHKGVWKPVQRGVIMATKSVLAIQEEMLTRGHRFVLTSRFTQDCLENTFSCVRSKNPIPTPVEFHHALRIISVGQFLTTIRSGNYQEDDSSFLADFLDTVEKNVTPSVRVEQLMVENRTAPDLTKTEKCILLHLAGYIVHKLIRFASICGKCKTATQHTDDNPAGDNSILVNLKEFKAGALCRPSQEAYDLTQQIEKLFRTKTSSYLMELPNAVDVLEKEAQSLSSRLPTCCEVQEKISKRFIRLRLRIEAKKNKEWQKKQHLNDGHLGSKSQSKKRKRTNISQASTSNNQQTASNTLVVVMETLGLTVAPISTSTQPSLLLHLPAPTQHHCSSTYQHPPNITAPPPTSTHPTSLLLHLPAPSHHCSSTYQHPPNTNPPPTSTHPTSLLLHLPAPTQH